MHTKLKKLFFIFAFFSIIFINNFADASNLGIGVHSGYGVLKYEEHTSAFGTDRKSDASLNTILLGVSGEYSFTKYEKIYTGITTDFAIGKKDRETWKDNGSESQANDIRVFGQFYDLRLGYKNNIDKFYYRAYISGGWDGIHIERDNVSVNGGVVNGETSDDFSLRRTGHNIHVGGEIIIRSEITSTVPPEDFSLWRIGGGIGVGYKFSKWALDGRAAYSYYPDGKVTNNDYEGIKFDTHGTCLDLGVGIGRAITNNIGFYIGGFYTLIMLDESEVKKYVSEYGTVKFILPDSRTELMGGVVNLTYAF
jgi:hypothetical protein